MSKNPHEIPTFNPYHTGARIIYKWRRAILFLSPEAEDLLEIAEKCGYLKVSYEVDEIGVKREKEVWIDCPILADRFAKLMNRGVTKFLRNADTAILTEIISEGIKEEKKPLLVIPPDPYWDDKEPDYYYPPHIQKIIEEQLEKQHGDLDKVVIQ